MHKKFLGIALPIIGAAVIVGAGFSAWAFTNTTVNVGLTGTVDITDQLSDFDVHLYYRYIAKYSDNHGDNETNPKYTYAELSSFTLELDQGVLYDTTTANIGITGYVPNVTYTDDSAALDKTSTINVPLDDNIFIEVRYTGTTSELEESFGDNNTLKISFGLDFTQRVGVSGANNPYALESYVDLTTGSKTPAAIEYTSVPITEYTTWSSTEVTHPIIYQSATGLSFEWFWIEVETTLEDGSTSTVLAKPQSGDEYDTMVTNLTDPSTFHLTFTAKPEWIVPTA